MPRYPYGTTVRLKLHRLRKTQRQLASELGYSPSYISLYLSGKLHNPGLRPQIAEILTRWEEET